MPSGGTAEAGKDEVMKIVQVVSAGMEVFGHVVDDHLVCQTTAVIGTTKVGSVVV